MTSSAPNEVTAVVSDDLDIPKFLLRNPDNSLKYPSASPPAAQTSGQPTAVETSNLVDELPAPPLAELQAAIEKKKSYARIRKLKAKKADQAAIAAGKTWDGIRGGWK